MLNDTSPEAERVWIDLWRKATPTERLRRARSLSARVIAMSRQAIAKARPELSQREQSLFWVRLHYGSAIEDQLRRHFAEQA